MVSAPGVGAFATLWSCFGSARVRSGIQAKYADQTALLQLTFVVLEMCEDRRKSDPFIVTLGAPGMKGRDVQAHGQAGRSGRSSLGIGVVGDPIARLRLDDAAGDQSQWVRFGMLEDEQRVASRECVFDRLHVTAHLTFAKPILARPLGQPDQ